MNAADNLDDEREDIDQATGLFGYEYGESWPTPQFIASESRAIRSDWDQDQLQRQSTPWVSILGGLGQKPVGPEAWTDGQLHRIERHLMAAGRIVNRLMPPRVRNREGFQLFEDWLCGTGCNAHIALECARLARRREVVEQLTEATVD